MAALTDMIITALSPGVALTSVIFFNTSLQNRFIYITGRARDLNKEARQLRSERQIQHRSRLTSIDWQVRLLLRRSRIVRHAVLIVYVALMCFILTILELLAVGFFQLRGLDLAPVFTFALGFVALGVAALYSGLEMALGQSTIVEDTRSSFESIEDTPADDPDAAPERETGIADTP